jgi:hypothetical protein
LRRASVLAALGKSKPRTSVLARELVKSKRPCSPRANVLAYPELSSRLFAFSSHSQRRGACPGSKEAQQATIESSKYKKKEGLFERTVAG